MSDDEKAALPSRRGMDPETRELGIRILTRAERAVTHMEGAASTFEAVARLHLSILRRMVPIVEDLGEMVRHNLNEARESRGLKPRAQRPRDVIDVDPESD